MSPASPLPLPDTIGGVLFDLDGTLVDLACDWQAARGELEQVAAGFGISSWPTRWIMEGITIIEDTLGPGAGARFRQQAWKRIEELELEAIGGTIPVEGSEDLIATLLDQHPVAVVTNNSPLTARRALELCNFPQIELVVGRGATTRVKPDPSMLELALTELDIEAANTVFLGDTPPDLEAGRAAGVATVFFQRPDRYLPQGFVADATVTSLQGFRKLLAV